MDIVPYIPIIVESTKFLFNELGKWLERSRQRQKETPNTKDSAKDSGSFSQSDLIALESDPKKFTSQLNIDIAETNVMVIKGLVEQLRIHLKNLSYLETVEAQYGLLTPQHIKHGIDLENSKIQEKSERLQQILSSIYGRQVRSS